MVEVIKNNFKNPLVILLIFAMVAGWFFAGWPKIWQKPSFPPKIQEVLAATFILKSTNSDLPASGADFDKEISTGTETAGTITVLVAGATTETSYAYTVADVPDNADWETGGMTVEVNVTILSTSIYLKLSASRVDSLGALQETSGETAEENLDLIQVYTFNIPSTDWTVGNCGDRIRINYIFRNSHPNKDRSVDIQTGTTDTEHTTSITQSGGGCAPVVSVSVSDGEITYGTLGQNSTKGTHSGDLNDTQTAINDGNVTEDFNIKGQDSANWTLGATAGSDVYVHQFCTATCTTPPTNYTALTTSYQTLATGIAESGNQTFDLYTNTPNPSSVYTEQSVNVTIQAVQAP